MAGGVTLQDGVVLAPVCVLQPSMIFAAVTFGRAKNRPAPTHRPGHRRAGANRVLRVSCKQNRAEE
jgi:hypothetical protein